MLALGRHERLTKSIRTGTQTHCSKARNKGWTKTRTPTWWLTAHTSQATLRRFWRGLPILRENFIEICAAVGVSDWQAIVFDAPLHQPADSKTGQIDWGEAPEIISFYGRTAELTQLEQWIVGEGCKVICLLGMGELVKPLSPSP